MTEAPRGDRAGRIRLSPHTPRGLLFLNPLYAPPPYQYSDDVVLIVAYEADTVPGQSGRQDRAQWRNAP